MATDLPAFYSRRCHCVVAFVVVRVSVDVLSVVVVVAVVVVVIFIVSVGVVVGIVVIFIVENVSRDSINTYLPVNLIFCHYHNYYPSRS